MSRETTTRVLCDFCGGLVLPEDASPVHVKLGPVEIERITQETRRHAPRGIFGDAMLRQSIPTHAALDACPVVCRFVRRQQGGDEVRRSEARRHAGHRMRAQQVSVLELKENRSGFELHWYRFRFWTLLVIFTEAHVTFEDIARVVHEANRAFCITQGDMSQVAWDDAPAWQRQSAMKGVAGIIEGRITKPQESHNSWLAEKKETGWKYGPVKDAEKKEHPCFVPYEDLPEMQKLKDHLFFKVVRVLEPHHAEPEAPTVADA